MPSRIIRESARTSPTIDALSFAAECLFWRLTTVADDFGRFDADPRVLLAACFPLRVDRLKVADVAAWFAEMVRVGLVHAYEVNGRAYGTFITWAKYQRTRPGTSRFPDPPAPAGLRESAANRGELPHIPTRSREKGAGRREKGAGRAETKVTGNSAAATPDGVAAAPGDLSPKLQDAILAMRVQAFHCLAEPTKANELFWDEQLDAIERHQVTVFACLPDVDTFYLGRRKAWPRSREEAAERMCTALETAIVKVLRSQRRRKYA